MVRGHEALEISEFNGLWRRGGQDTCPPDHFTDAVNVRYTQSSVASRYGTSFYQDLSVALGDILRVYNYIIDSGDSLLVLVDGGDIYHAIGDTIVYGPILSINEMTDFSFVAFNGRAYITPFYTQTDARGVNYQVGMEDEVVYVYLGDGSNARAAAGSPPTNSSLTPLIAFNSGQAGVVEQGAHVIAIAQDGSLKGPQVFPVVLAPGNRGINLINIPTGGTTIKVVMTRAIDPADYTSNQTTYTYYEVASLSANETSYTINVADADLTVVYGGSGAAPTFSGLTALNTATAGYVDFGLHLYAVVYETNTGFLTAPGPEFFAAQTAVDITKKVRLNNIPVSADSFVTKRHIVATKAIRQYNGDQEGFQFFFVPDGTINDNTTTFKEFSFYDTDLLEDASHLLDNLTEIPAGVAINTYHGRMAVAGEFDNISLVRVSAIGEPEAISAVDGLLELPLDGNPITNLQEFRDIFYVFKSTRTVAFNDNGDVPSSWPLIIIDQGVGAPVHGIGTVLDSGGVNVDYLIITDYSGVMLFNGAYQRPELSWKIKEFWFSLTRNDFNLIHFVNDSISQVLYIVLPDGTLLYGDYSVTLDYMKIKWAIWTFPSPVTSITLIETNKLILTFNGV